SRRRHTRSKRDWSSDVCSSDLRSEGVLEIGQFIGEHHRVTTAVAVDQCHMRVGTPQQRRSHRQHRCDTRTGGQEYVSGSLTQVGSEPPGGYTHLDLVTGTYLVDQPGGEQSFGDQPHTNTKGLTGRGTDGVIAPLLHAVDHPTQGQ